jgi:hypothetical protein
MMNKFKVRVRADWGGQSDTVKDYFFDSDKPLEEFTQDMNRNGFIVDWHRGILGMGDTVKRWWAPASINWIEQE